MTVVCTDVTRPASESLTLGLMSVASSRIENDALHCMRLRRTRSVSRRPFFPDNSGEAALWLSIQNFAHFIRKGTRAEGLLEKIGSRGQDAVMDDGILTIA
jgi:hypothetical protein